MHTWRKVGYCLFAAIAAGLAGVASATTANGVEQTNLADDSAFQSTYVHYVCQGTNNEFQGHPTAIKTEEGILAVWSYDHGGHCGAASVSSDGGATWTSIDNRFPADYALHVSCPSIYRLKDAQEQERLFIYSSAKLKSTGQYAANLTGKHVIRFQDDCAYMMPSLMSADDGLTWVERDPLGKKFTCVMAFSDIIPLSTPGAYMAVYHCGTGDTSTGFDNTPLTCYKSFTTDGGLTWSDPVAFAFDQNLGFCEPCLIKSPDGNEICCILRENVHFCPSYVTFSSDEGQTWTTPIPLPAELAGHRHQAKYLKDGRLLIAFRGGLGWNSTTKPTTGDPMCWIGSYEHLKSGNLAGSRQIKLMNKCQSQNAFDSGYPGVVVLDDGTAVVVTYNFYDTTNASVMSVTLTPEKLSSLTTSLPPDPVEPPEEEEVEYDEVIYVDSEEGNDGNSGAEDAPLKTLAAAATKADVVGQKTHILLADGTYDVSSPILFDKGNTVHIEGISKDPTKVTIRNTGSNRIISVYRNPQDTVRIDFLLRYVTLTSGAVRAALMKDGRLANCIITGNTFPVANDGNKDGGVIYITNYVTIENCLFYNNSIGNAYCGQLSCKKETSSPSDAHPRVINCTFINPSNRGGVASDWSNCEVINCVEYGSGVAAKINNTASVATMKNCAGDYTSGSTGFVQLTADPFVDSANGDYRPKSDSGLIGAGSASDYSDYAISSVDLAGQSRFHSSALDIGAYQGERGTGGDDPVEPPSTVKKVSIIGDSYSAIEGTLPSGNGARPGITEAQSYWYQFIQAIGGQKEVNQSWSGSLVCNYNGDGQRPKSMIHADRIGNIGNPDIILVFGGTNDAWKDAPRGNGVNCYDPANWTPENLATFRPAYAYLLNYLTNHHANAEIICLINSTNDCAGTTSWSASKPGIHPETAQDIAEIAAHYGCKFVQLHDIAKSDDHPTVAGHATIASQLLAVYNGEGGDDDPPVGPGGDDDPPVGPGGDDDPPVGPGGDDDPVGPGGDDPQPTVVGDYSVITNATSIIYVFTNAAEDATCSLTLDEGLVLTRALLVGGGGGGGGGNGGGGGAGGMLELELNQRIAKGAVISFKVGAGGAGGAAEPNTSFTGADATTLGTQGEDTTLTIGTTTYTAKGGGYGASRYAAPSTHAGGGHNGGAGGSGGGAAYGQTGGAATDGQGNAGGSGPSGQQYNMLANGGGGAGAAGGAASTSANSGNPVYLEGGAGGDGKMSNITGSEVYYAGGGGGGATARDSGDLRLCKIGKGGLGGGGDSAGGNSNSIPDKYAEYRGTLQLAKPGTDGLGGGGGGGNCYASGADNWVSSPGAKGGSGTVILCFAKPRKIGSAVVYNGKIMVALGDATSENEYLYCAYGATNGGNDINAWDKVFAIANVAGLAAGEHTFSIPTEVLSKDYPFAQLFIAGQSSAFTGFKAGQEVVQVAEYATLDGTQFVNTRRLFGGLEDLEMKVMPTEVSTDYQRIIFWSRYAPSGNYTRALFWYNISKGGLRYDYKTKVDNSGYTLAFTNWKKDSEYVIRTEGPQYFINGSQVRWIRTDTQPDKQTDFAGAPLFLFAQGTYSSASVTEEVMDAGATRVSANASFVGRFYYADILDEGDKVIVHYVGAIDPTDGKKKLYDALSGTFISPKLTPSAEGAEPMNPEAETEFTSLENFSWNVPAPTPSCQVRAFRGVTIIYR